MSYNIIPTSTFQKDVKNLKKKYRHIASDLEKFSNTLTDNPFYGEAIKGIDCFYRLQQFTVFAFDVFSLIGIGLSSKEV